jgi:phosphate transport system ATP-binding protein
MTMLEIEKTLKQRGPRTSIAPKVAIGVSELSLRYGKKVAFENVTLPIYEKHITVIVGPSGCGKTSFLQCLNRLTDLIPGTALQGRVNIGDTDLLSPEMNLIGLRRQVGMIFQKPNPFPMSIKKNLAFPLKEHGVHDKTKRDALIEKSLREAGLWDEVKDRLDESALKLSGGQQQRLCIARALALDPQIILMDEPCSSLDPLSSAVVEDLILSLRERYTVVVVTHNLAQARRIGDYLAFFWSNDNKGRLVEFGPAEHLFEKSKYELTSAYLRGLRG